ncbi:MAG: nickel pincer cofactor biosynthesis protein LarB [Candidatus Heimdallarchaeota archaeon]|nr:nickel pincer cofactor biosynthesis protein LarB [Candidatus Heimdallarchaeota archaeon]
MSVNHDSNRSSITGIPEVILAEPKLIEDLLHAITMAMDRNARVLITRIQPSQIESIKKLLDTHGWKSEFDAIERTLMIYDKDIAVRSLSAAILSAGTSDRYVVEEIRLTMKFFGWSTQVIQDVGVAGIHRHKEALSSLDTETKCIIVVAGQEGAIFPVIAAQTKLPVIAVPSAVGYGFGGKGETALRSALQSCAPGIATMNIDNGFGAAAFASKLLQLFI